MLCSLILYSELSGMILRAIEVWKELQTEMD